MSVRETLQGWCTDIFAGDLFKDVEEILSLNPSTGDYSAVWNTICGIYENVCVPIGMGLVLIYFVVSLYERATQQNFDLEHVVKMFLKLFIGLYFIEHGLELMASIYSLGFSFVSSIASKGGEEYDAAQHVKTVWINLTGESWNGEDWGTLKSIMCFLSYGLSLLIPWLVIKILSVVVNFVCFSRLIEFYIRTAVAPIALSDFFTEGMHSNGWKFIKGYIAIALQSGIIMLAVVIFQTVGSSILGSEFGSYWGGLIKYLALAFATVGVMLKSLSLTKEIVGGS